MDALIFDCDGVLADTERDGHRVAFNEAFRAMGLEAEWDEALYGRLLAVAGGKERMRGWFDSRGWPADVRDREAFIRELHRLKTDRYLEIISQGRLPLRPGVARLVDEAISAGLKLSICSTSDARGVTLIAETLLGRDRAARFLILAGDVVQRKKPDPEIYVLAGRRLQAAPGRCVVVEDSRNGLLAARGAGMRCIVTTSSYTQGEDFSEADAVAAELGDPPNACVRLEDLRRICA